MELEKLSKVIVEYMGKALNMKEMEMRELFEDGIQVMRMNYYPPCPQPEKVIGLTPHSDGSALTVLLQLNDVQGLQVRKDGMWVRVKPLPNAFIINIGDILEVKLYQDIKHMILINKL
jgi:isopenicillin N synthase-like dioxygenase